MKLSVKSEYAFLALIYLARNYQKGYFKIKEISQNQKIPKKYLEQILLILKNSGIVKSRLGSEGGYRISKKPSEIYLAEIIRVLDGALAPLDSVSKYFYAPTPLEREPGIIKVFRDIRNFIAQKLENTSLADVI